MVRGEAIFAKYGGKFSPEGRPSLIVSRLKVAEQTPVTQMAFSDNRSPGINSDSGYCRVMYSDMAI